MKSLIVLLLVTLSFTAILAWTSSYYEFVDTEGECWRCYSGFPCERCIRSYQDLRTLWNAKCPIPNCNDRNLRHILFPSRESNNFFQCLHQEDHWIAERIECQCELLFSFELQSCVPLRQWTPFCLQINLPVMYRDCETGEKLMIGGRRDESVIEDQHLEFH